MVVGGWWLVVGGWWIAVDAWCIAVGGLRYSYLMRVGAGAASLRCKARNFGHSNTLPAIGR